MTEAARSGRAKAVPAGQAAPAMEAGDGPDPAPPLTRRASQLAAAPDRLQAPRQHAPRQRAWRGGWTLLLLAGAGTIALGLYLLQPEPKPVEPGASSASNAATPAPAPTTGNDAAVAVATRNPQAVDDDGAPSIIMPEGSLHGDGLPVRLPPPPAPRPADAGEAERANAAGDAAADVDIAAIQRHLAALAFEPGRTDGVLDESTRQAIERFQQFAGLKVTGRPSSALASELAALAEEAQR